MKEDTSTRAVQAANQPSAALVEHLKRFLREMPLSVCRELLTLYVERIRRRVEERERPRRDCLALPRERGGETFVYTADVTEDFRRLAGMVRESLDMIETLIAEKGEEVRLGDFEDYDEGPALKLWLTATGWARQSRIDSASPKK